MIGLRAGAAIGALVVLAGWGYGQWRAGQAEQAVTLRYERAIAAQKADAAQVLARESDKVLRLERSLTQAAQRIREQDDARQKTSAEYEERLAAAVAAGAGRLRDPHASGCGAGGDASAGAAPADAGRGAARDAQAGGVLSERTTADLLALVRAADEVNDAYAACRADAQALRDKLSPSP